MTPYRSIFEPKRDFHYAWQAKYMGALIDEAELLSRWRELIPADERVGALPRRRVSNDCAIDYKQFAPQIGIIEPGYSCLKTITIDEACAHFRITRALFDNYRGCAKARQARRCVIEAMSIAGKTHGEIAAEMGQWESTISFLKKEKIDGKARLIKHLVKCYQGGVPARLSVTNSLYFTYHEIYDQVKLEAPQCQGHVPHAAWCHAVNRVICALLLADGWDVYDMYRFMGASRQATLGRIRSLEREPGANERMLSYNIRLALNCREAA